MPRHLLVLVTLSVTLTACSKSPTDPSGDNGGSTLIQGQTVNAIDGAAAGNATVRVGDRSVTTDGSGFFQLDPGRAGSYSTTIRGAGMVDRDTRISSPAADRLRLSLIPSSFDLAAFDQMFRTLNSRLARWTTRPSLVVLAAVMDYRGSGDTYEATGEQLTDEEVSLMIAHHQEGLVLLTGGVYTSFAAVDVERPAAGTRVNPLRTGAIVVGRYRGIVSFARTIGYGQWAEMSDGTINGGATFLDRDFDRGDTRRRLLRIHELGHALGYQHVDVRTSIMNPAIGPEPNDFDRAGAIIAFQRPVGNRSPDTDPATTASATTGAYRWSAPTVCR